MNKTIRITNRALWESVQPLSALINERLPRKVSYTCGWNAERVQRETKIIAEERTKIIREYAEKDAKGNPVINEEGIVQFASVEDRLRAEEEIAELMAIEHEAFEYRPVCIDDIPEDAQIPGIVFMQLSWMFEEAPVEAEME